MAIYDKLYYGCAEDVNMNGMDMLCPEFCNKGKQSEFINTNLLFKGANAVTDGFSDGLITASELRIGSNKKLYFKSDTGSVFRGNKHISTKGLSSHGYKNLALKGSVLKKTSGSFGYALAGIDIAQGIQKDGGSFGYNAQKATAGATGSIAGKKTVGKSGAKIGAKAGLKLGAKIGLIAGPKGVVVGAAVGGIIGGVGGALSGSYVGKKAYDGARNVARKTGDFVKNTGKSVRKGVGKLVGGLFG